LHFLIPFILQVTIDACKVSIYIITYLLTPWSRVLLEKLTGSESSQEIPRFFEIRRFVTIFITARHCPLSLTSLIQSTTFHSTALQLRASDYRNTKFMGIVGTVVNVVGIGVIIIIIVIIFMNRLV